MSFDLIPIIDAIRPMANTAISSIVGVLMTALFLRGNTNTSEFEKFKAGKFNEALDELLKSGKMSYMELYKCKNFLVIAKKAEEICSETKIAEINANNNQRRNNYEEPSAYDFDWFVRFFDAAGNVSNDKMQQLWARILAGEVQQPGTFSLRTIETLYNMTHSEATLFQTIASIILMEYDGSKFIYRSEYSDFEASDAEINGKYGFGAQEFAILEECGLLSSLRQESYATVINESIGIYNDNIILMFQVKSDIEGKEPFQYSCYMLTQTALQLLSIVQAEPNDKYIIDLGVYLKKRNPGFLITAHKILSIKSNEVSYDVSKDLLE